MSSARHRNTDTDRPGRVGNDRLETMDSEVHRGAHSSGFAISASPGRGAVLRGMGLDRASPDRDMDDFRAVPGAQGADPVEEPSFTAPARRHYQLWMTVSNTQDMVRWAANADTISDGLEARSRGRRPGPVLRIRLPRAQGSGERPDGGLPCHRPGAGNPVEAWGTGARLAIRSRAFHARLPALDDPAFGAPKRGCIWWGPSRARSGVTVRSPGRGDAGALPVPGLAGRLRGVVERSDASTDRIPVHHRSSVQGSSARGTPGNLLKPHRSQASGWIVA